MNQFWLENTLNVKRGKAWKDWNNEKNDTFPTQNYAIYEMHSEDYCFRWKTFIFFTKNIYQIEDVKNEKIFPWNIRKRSISLFFFSVMLIRLSNAIQTKENIYARIQLLWYLFTYIFLLYFPFLLFKIIRAAGNVEMWFFFSLLSHCLRCARKISSLMFMHR